MLLDPPVNPTNATSPVFDRVGRVTLSNRPSADDATMLNTPGLAGSQVRTKETGVPWLSRSRTTTRPALLICGKAKARSAVGLGKLIFTGPEFASSTITAVPAPLGPDTLATY